MSGEFRLRELLPTDGPAIAKLDRESPDTGTVAFSTVYLDDPYAALAALHPGVVGVAAVEPGKPDIIGMGAMTLGRCQLEGELHPYSYLFNISVKPEHRRRGIASQIYSWLIGTARERLGDDAIIIAGIQEGNEASIRAARVWSSDLLKLSQSAMTRMRDSAPRPVGRLVVRDAADSEWEAIAQSQNRFYREYNLYPPRTASELRDAHAAAPLGTPIRHYFVAVDAKGEIAAGMSITDEGSIEPIQIVRMPLPMRIGNAILDILPSNGTVRRIPVRDLWFAQSRIEAATYLWESVRWLWRERADAMMAFVDPRSPLSGAIPRMRFLPRNGGYIALAAPTRPSKDRFLYHYA